MSEQKPQPANRSYDFWFEVANTVSLLSRKCSHFGPIEKHECAWVAITTKSQSLEDQLNAFERHAAYLAEREFAGLDG